MSRAVGALCAAAAGGTETAGAGAGGTPPGYSILAHRLGPRPVEELYMPTKSTPGLTLRTFDPEKRQWSLWWVTSATGRLDPVPVVGGFQGNRGEFYAADHATGRAVKVRFISAIRDHDHARWEQAFSYDDRTWQTVTPEPVKSSSAAAPLTAHR